MTQSKPWLFQPLYPFKTMEVGGAFEFPITDERDAKGKLVDVKRVRQAASQYKRRAAPEGWQYTVRKLDAGTGEFRRLA